MTPECNPTMKPDRPVLDDVTITHLLRAYLDAHYRWGTGGRWHPVVIGKPLPDIEACFPQAARFGMLSAWNPLSVPRPEARNRAEDRRLEARLQAGGWGHVPGFASAPNRTWREPNWLVAGITPAELDALAREFRQLGTLQWERGQPVRLRMDAPRPALVAPQRYVDWIQ